MSLSKRFTEKFAYAKRSGKQELTAGQMLKAIVEWMREVDPKERLTFLAMLKAVIL